MAPRKIMEFRTLRTYFKLFYCVTQNKLNSIALLLASRTKINRDYSIRVVTGVPE